LSRSLDKLSLIGMALGVAMMLQPWWARRIHARIFCDDRCSTALQIVTSHLVKPNRSHEVEEHWMRSTAS
jgi:hypothetical protein